MDKSLYVAMSGARATLQAQGTVAHNLANAETAGFKAALANTQAYLVPGGAHASRIDAMHIDQGFDSRVGAQRVTGNPLDVSLRPDRWLAVQSADGGEAYTRAGNLSLTPNGQLVTAGGHPLVDENGLPMTLPPHQALDVGQDGTVSIVPLGEGPQTLAIVGRIRVVEATPDRLARGLDGLMRNADPQQPLAQAAGDTMVTGALEASNVDAAGALVQMIQLQRQFEMQVKLIQRGDDNAQAANSLLRLGG
ncbi:flagellar basal body rod protein FlgF [Luteimonas sp. FCS-9]|uniref:flagellar basal body rod protein FlgF n=1 Tax=Luteimonas sp. FCS-9 TaxID=1547516 RepID=UPI00063E946A|nr:flagellar basal body rod protein FlgF [Luteimonas sp. FCS-9]KLJ02730.1 flagellar basal body rod protein FlgF [Luteimonas sp. FCS-9]